MKVVLINPSINKRKFGKFRILMEPVPCPGLAYIVAVLEKEEHSVKIIDNNVYNYPTEELLEKIWEYFPDMIGISVHS